MENEIAIAAAMISGLSAIAAIYSSVKARQQAKDASNSATAMQIEATRISEESRSLQALEWTTQYFEGVRQWADIVVLRMSETMHLSLIEDPDFRRQEWIRVRSQLSASIDTGRWYFPNKFAEMYGQHKPPAYRGDRRRVLDYICFAYDALPTPPEFFQPGQQNDSYTTKAYSKIEGAKRQFVSEIQEVLNPRHREAQVNEVQEQFKIADSMRSPADQEAAPTSA